MSILNSLFQLNEIVNQAPFSPQTIEASKPIIKKVSTYLKRAGYPKLSDNQMFYYLVLLAISLDDNSIRNSDIISFLNIRKMELIQLRFEKILKELEELGYVEIRITDGRRGYNREISIPEFIHNCIIIDKQLPPKKDIKYDLISFTHTAKSLIKQIDMGVISLAIAVEKLKALQSKFRSPIVDLIEKIALNHVDYYIFLICIYDYINEPYDHKVQLPRLLGDILENDSMMLYQIKKEFLMGNNYLQLQKLVKSVDEDEFHNGLTIALSDDIIEQIEQEVDVINVTPKTFKELVKINEKDIPNLYYNPDVQQEIDRLKTILEPTRFKELIQTFKSNSLPSHLNILLSGEAGTGKTELAKLLSLDKLVYNVDVSNWKSSFYGESQKLVQQHFTKFRKMAQKNPFQCVMVLNEADALIGKRLNEVIASSDQTNNAIQNIILTNIEHLGEGAILIATTNKSDFIDDAFARRFMFKINVSIPTPETAIKIWKHYLAGYSDNLYNRLALLNLSGGFISNICRKVMIEKMVYQSSVSEDLIHSWALSESSYSKTSMVNVKGFQKAS